MSRSGAGGAGGAAASPPPPLPTAPQFHVAVDGRATGPFELALVVQRIRAGQVARDALVWRPGMAQWTAAGDVAELREAFAAAPPPLPR
jgi:hypothetical protein